MAHGIRNPLANIRAAAQVALDAQADRGTTAKYLDAITAEVDRLGRWLRALLDSVRPFELRPAPTPVNAVVEDVLALLGDRIARGEVKVERDLAGDLPLLMADGVQLEQALLGVLENSLDALAPGGTLRVRTEGVAGAGPPRVRLTIRDTGEGIPPERLARIFEPFYTTKTRGTGLGLAITRKVVDGHGGDIGIASEPGSGTTFTITLPVEMPAP